MCTVELLVNGLLSEARTAECLELQDCIKPTEEKDCQVVAEQVTIINLIGTMTENLV